MNRPSPADPPQTRLEAFRHVAAKAARPRELFLFLRWRLREGNEYPFHDLVDFFPGLGAMLASLGPTRIDLDAPVFLAGLRRSGTTLFYRLMGAHPDLRLFNERYPGDRMNGYGFATDENVWSVRDPDSFRRVTFRYLSPLQRMRRGRWGVKLALQLVDPNPGSVSADGFRQLLEVFPRGRFLAIVRDPRDFVLSAVRRRGFDDDYWCAQYRAAVDLFEESIERHPDMIRLVRYEDLVLDPEKTLESCCRFVGLSYCEHMLNPAHWSRKGPKEYARESVVAETEKWRAEAARDPARVERIESQCFPPAARVGYSATSSTTRGRS